MKKLYLGKQTVSVLLVADENTSTKTLQWEISNAVSQEATNVHEGHDFAITVINQKSEIPKEWRNCPVYGIGDGDVTGEEFLASQDPEYQEFLRLKSKFEPGDVPEIVKYLDNK